MEVESGSRFSSITNSTTNKSALGTFSGISNLHFRFQCKWSHHSLEHKFFLMFVSKYVLCSMDHSPIGFKVCNPLCKPRRKVLLVVWGLCLEYCKTPLQTWQVSVCVAVSGGSAHACFVWWNEMFCLEKQKQNKTVSVCSAPCRQFWTHGHLEDQASNQ
jgi:hypothetical protein